MFIQGGKRNNKQSYKDIFKAIPDKALYFCFIFYGVLKIIQQGRDEIIYNPPCGTVPLRCKLVLNDNNIQQIIRIGYIGRKLTSDNKK